MITLTIVKLIALILILAATGLVILMIYSCLSLSSKIDDEMEEKENEYRKYDL